MLLGYGCHLHWQFWKFVAEVAKAITDTDLLASAILSGNRNFEGRINPFG